VKHGSVYIRDSHLVIESPPHVSIRLRRLFGGAQRYRAGVFKLAATPEHAYDLRWFSERHPLDVRPDSLERFNTLVAQHEKRLVAIAELDTAGYVPREFELALPLREYQRVAADLAIRSGRLLVADQLGLGKTITAIGVMSSTGSLPALVVTMTHLALQWEREVARFAPSLRVHRIRKTQPYSFKDIRIQVDPTTGRRKVVRYTGTPDVIIITYSKLHGWVESLAGVVRYLVFDECQEFRTGETTKKWKAGRALSQDADIVVGLSATPIYNYGNEIHNVFEALAPGQLGTSKEFVDEWCGGPMHNGKASVADPAALGSYLRESGLMIRRTRKDAGRELPALSVVRHAVEADEGYLDKVADDVAELARRVLDRIGTPEERMHTAGELDWRLRQATGIAKAGPVADHIRLLVEAGERPVVFAWHHEVYSVLTSALERHNITTALYTGKQSDSQKDRAKRAFIDGQAQVLIISLRSGAGLDGLQHVSSTVVIAELDWSPQVIDQCIGRVYRDGQPNPVIAYVLTAETGSDPVISDVLGIKVEQSHYMLNPEADGMPEFQGAAADHIKRLAEDVIARRKTKT
jgi:SNF2 family DNA or RNA helicase